ncbi:hypothetical protein [Limosilactobacillus fermentum]|uniref:hypothetical protein n=1 Tax=Limosilactobacillus fermentum TaxID=1613 RepID=UPI002F261A20
MSYQDEMNSYNKKVKLLQKVEALDRGAKGTQGNVSGVYLLGYDETMGTYLSDRCLAVGPLKMGLPDSYTINGQLGDYKIYLLNQTIDPKQDFIIIVRGSTARILLGYRLVLTINVGLGSDQVVRLSGGLTELLTKGNGVADKPLADLLHPEDDEIKSDF